MGLERRSAPATTSAEPSNAINGGSCKANHLRLVEGRGWERKRKRFHPRKIVLVIIATSVLVILTFRLPKLLEQSSPFSSEDLYHRALAQARENQNGKNGCAIPRFRIDDARAVGLGTNVGPVILEGWDFRASEWTRAALMDRAGDYPQYLKDRKIHPLTKIEKPPIQEALRGNNQNDDLCILKGKDLAELLPDHENLRFFTNNMENEPFMKELRNIYSVPKIVEHISMFEIFSALSEGKYFGMHSHGETWLGQVSGRRMWWLLPPDSTPKPTKVDACGYLKGTEMVPANAMACVQNPGEIMWFPRDWFHATCALDDWNAGIGAQQGRSDRKLDPVKLNPHEFAVADKDGSYPRSRQEILEACLDPAKAEPATHHIGNSR